jgi:hypothetical protein
LVRAVGWLTGFARTCVPALRALADPSVTVGHVPIGSTVPGGRWGFVAGKDTAAPSGPLPLALGVWSPLYQLLLQRIGCPLVPGATASRAAHPGGSLQEIYHILEAWPSRRTALTFRIRYNPSKGPLGQSFLVLWRTWQPPGPHHRVPGSTVYPSPATPISTAPHPNDADVAVLGEGAAHHSSASPRADHFWEHHFGRTISTVTLIHSFLGVPGSAGHRPIDRRPRARANHPGGAGVAGGGAAGLWNNACGTWSASRRCQPWTARRWDEGQRPETPPYPTRAYSLPFCGLVYQPHAGLQPGAPSPLEVANKARAVGELCVDASALRLHGFRTASLRQDQDSVREMFPSPTVSLFLSPDCLEGRNDFRTVSRSTVTANGSLGRTASRSDS